MANDTKGAKPDYILFAKVDKKAPTSRIGVAWRTGEGGKGLSIKLNTGVRIGWDDDLMLHLWPNVPWTDQPQNAASTKDSPPVPANEDTTPEGDIPF